MPRYLRVADVPAILKKLQGKEAEFQLDKWQLEWCEILDAPVENAAVLSYRWRTRGSNESLLDYRVWLDDCRAEGYRADDLKPGPNPVDWSLMDNVSLQIEVAAWLLWLHTHSVAEYAWVDQMCVPQDADIEEKMGHIRDSPRIYALGKVYVVLPPVVDEAGRIMTAAAARELVQAFEPDMQAYLDMPHTKNSMWRKAVDSPAKLSRVCVLSLLINLSYMRRVWTIQEAAAARELHVWPLRGTGIDVSRDESYQGPGVVSMDEALAWNEHPGMWGLLDGCGDPVMAAYCDGNYAELIRTLRARPPGAVNYLAMAGKEVFWTPDTRRTLVRALQLPDATAAFRAYWVLSTHISGTEGLQAARCFAPQDRVLALVPLVDYDAWREAIAGVPAAQLTQASVAWAYGLMEMELGKYKWALRCYHHPSSSARGLGQLQPRRHYSDAMAVAGTLPGEAAAVTIPPAGGKFSLPPPPASDPEAVRSHLASALPPAHEAAPLELRVEAAALMPHPGQAAGKTWRHWFPFAQLTAPQDGNFHQTVQLNMQAWIVAEDLDAERCAAMVVSGEGLVAMLLLALPKGGGEQPATGQVMAVLQFFPELLGRLVEEVGRQQQAPITWDITAVVAGAGASPASAPSPPAPAAAAPAPALEAAQPPAEEEEERRQVAEQEPQQPQPPAAVTAAAAPAAAAQPHSEVPLVPPLPQERQQQQEQGRQQQEQGQGRQQQEQEQLVHEMALPGQVVEQQQPDEQPLPPPRPPPPPQQQHQQQQVKVEGPGPSGAVAAHDTVGSADAGAKQEAGEGERHTQEPKRVGEKDGAAAWAAPAPPQVGGAKCARRWFAWPPSFCSD